MTEKMEKVQTILRVDADLHEWIRIYSQDMTVKQRTLYSINRTVNELLAEAIEARKQSQQVQEAK